MTTSFSFVSYTGNGTNTTFNVPFQYISKSHVEVYEDGFIRTAGISWDNDSTIRLTPAPGSGVVVRLERNTPKTTAIVDFQDAGVLTESALDLNTRQALFVVQEAFDEASNLVSQAVAAATSGAQIAQRSVPTVAPAAVGRFLVGRASDTYGWTDNLSFDETSGTLTVKRLNSDALSVDTSGRVGIGTSSPEGRLDVRGPNSSLFALFSGLSRGLRVNIDGTRAAVEGVDSTGVASYQPLSIGGSRLSLETSGVERVRLEPTGRLGLNTSSPAATLHTVGTTGTTAAQIIGPAGGLYVDFNGLNQNFYDANDHIFRNGGATERFRITASGQLRASSGTVTAPVYSFAADTDTGIYSAGAGNVDIAANGQRVLSLTNSGGANFVTLENATGNLIAALYLSLKDASATVSRASFTAAVNENFVPVSAIGKNLSTDGSSNIVLSATPPGSRTVDRRVVRMTIPGDGAISLVGPVNVSSGGQTVTGDLEASGNLRFNSGYGSAAIAYGVRAWCLFNGTGTVTILGSGNLSSITDNGAGDYTANYVSPMPDTNYGFFGTARGISGAFNGSVVAPHHSFAPTVTSIRFLVGNLTSVPEDRDRISICIVR